MNTVRGCPWLQLCCPEFGIVPYVLFQLWIKYWGNGFLWRTHVFLLFLSFRSCFFEPLMSSSIREAVWSGKWTGCIFSIRHLNIQLWLTVLQLYLSFQLLGWFHSDVISVETGWVLYPCLWASQDTLLMTAGCGWILWLCICYTRESLKSQSQCQGVAVIHKWGLGTIWISVA